jgi:hypothetical protein
MKTVAALSSRMLFIVSFALVSSPVARTDAAVLDKDRALAAQTFWDNRDFDWFKANIPFFDCPDAEIVTTYYYRWELITKHLTYGSPNSGYSFTEFIDRPFWSGAYGAISCPAGHQLYEVRWLRDAAIARDYSRYWFRTEGAQPRRYGTWIPDGVWGVHQVHPDDAFVKELLPDLIKNYEGWEKRQFVPEVGLFWQNGHDDGMEFNINSRQTKDILRGANGYRPGFNAYMWADALAIARIARLAGDEAAAKTYEAKAAGLKEKLQKLLWDPKREFFFPMSMRDETDKEGNVVKKHTLTYQSGKFAGSPHGREEHAYIPWQFNLPDAGFEAAWKFLMDSNYFYAPYGPLTVERNDPLFLLQKSCCWWSGQSWPFSTAQTLKALANLLQNYQQNHISRADYAKLLHIFAISHRKNGRPYLAEALHPDTGSFEGHDGYNHSEHYFHSSFNDLVITGLIGLKTRNDDMLELDPLASKDWAWFALDDVPYRGHRLSILWDKDGSRYGKGAGLRVLADGKELASMNQLGKVLAKLPSRSAGLRPGANTDDRSNEPGRRPALQRMNFAVNNDGDYYPRFTATFTAPKTSLDKVNDGNFWYTIHPPNRWTTTGSSNAADAIGIDFGTPRRIDTVKLLFLDDSDAVTNPRNEPTKILAPAGYTLEFHDGSNWQPVPGQKRAPEAPAGHRPNTVQFPAREIRKLRATFTHAKGGFTGLTEFEAWGEGARPYVAPPAKPGNLAYNPTGQGFPKATASHSDVYGGVPKSAIDGRIIYKTNPVNRWTSYGSPSPSDWLEVDFGSPKEVSRAELYIFDDRGGVQAPTNYVVQVFANGEWSDAAGQVKSPATPTGGAMNTVTFSKATTSKIRVVFTHKGKAKSGVTELELWKE